MNMRKLIPIVVLLIFLIVGCSKPQIVNNSPLVIDQNNKIEVELKISTYNQKGKVIEGVELILIGYDGEVIDTLKTDSKGEVIKKKAPRSALGKKHMADNIKISDIEKEDGVDFVKIGPNKGGNSEF